METYAITNEQIAAYGANLCMEERCEATVQKYVSAVMALFRFLPPEKTLTREFLLAWKAEISARFSASGANVMISAVNRFCEFMSWSDLHIRQIKVQRRVFRDCERELTKAEYTRLLNAARAKGNPRLYWLMQTLASTGIRVSELRFVSVESLRNGRAVVDCKGKRRVVMIPQKLREKLLAYCAETGVKSGAVFVSRNGKPLNRSNIWRELQGLCATARVDARKVFPHNFRHLFAVTFYRMEKDIAKLADLLGHASINTTRIYIMESGAEHERRMEKLGLVV
ncbi:MAG: tyrosine-type recombinase/integrase [Oscillibacter sp.]|nr:tyrosine-type recombinase/integrase [Oscillibacter sp.]